MTSKVFGLFALLLAVILIPEDSSADIFGLFSRNDKDLSEEELESIEKGLNWFRDRLSEKFSHAIGEVRSVTGKLAEGIQSTVDGAIYDAKEAFGAIASLFNPTIFPGTNWCGAGSRARGYDHFGVFGTADHCCRDHDNCPDIILAGDSRHGLKNHEAFTLSHCDCDDALYWCLKNSSSLVAKKIGATFFNILKWRCFKYDYPRKCTDGSSSEECFHYEQDKTAPKVWQWFVPKPF